MLIALFHTLGLFSGLVIGLCYIDPQVWLVSSLPAFVAAVCGRREPTAIAAAAAVSSVCSSDNRQTAAAAVSSVCSSDNRQRGKFTVPTTMDVAIWSCSAWGGWWSAMLRGVLGFRMKVQPHCPPPSFFLHWSWCWSRQYNVRLFNECEISLPAEVSLNWVEVPIVATSC